MSPTRSHVTRILHAALLLTVLHQLASSLWAEKPLPGDDMGWPYYLHERIGIVGFAVLCLFWLWVLARGPLEPSPGHLCPWFSAPRRSALVADVVALLRAFVRLRAPQRDFGALAGATHGLGLLLASWMALTGIVWFFVFDGGVYGRSVLGLHRVAANLMWVYLIGHALAALAHQALGDDVFSRMFWFKRPKMVSGE